MIREIKDSEWPSFCERLTKQHAGATVKMEVIEPSGVKDERASNAALQSIMFEKTDGCSDLIVLRLRGEREIVHQMVEPIRVLLHSAGGTDDFGRVEIEAESGVTILTLHPVIHGKMLEDLKAR